MPTPALRTDETINTLNSMLTGKIDSTEFAVARVKKDLNNLKSEYPSQGYALEGMLETVLHNQDEAIEAFRKAIQLTGNGIDPVVSHIYALSLASMGTDFDSVVGHLRRIASTCQTMAVDANLMASLGAILEAEKLVIEHNPSDLTTGFLFAETASFMRSTELSDADVIPAMEYSARMVWNSGFRVCGANDYVIDDGMLRCFIVNRTAPENLLNNWESEIDDFLIKQNSHLLAAGFSIGFYSEDEDITQVG
jgi:hypothetical protein